MTPREKVSDMLADALRADGCENVSAFDIYDSIWVPSGGQRQLDIARWDVQLHGIQRDGFAIPIHVHSWSTLTDLSKQKKLKLIAHSVREYEAT